MIRCFFFFSSRRRHTRCSRDWSSDVCSSDLAMLSPAALSILTTTFDEGRERNIALGIWGAVSGSGAAAGVLLGGALTSAFSWSWIFYINVPVGILVLAL